MPDVNGLLVVVGIVSALSCIGMGLLFGLRIGVVFPAAFLAALIARQFTDNVNIVMVVYMVTLAALFVPQAVHDTRKNMRESSELAAKEAVARNERIEALAKKLQDRRKD